MSTLHHFDVLLSNEIHFNVYRHLDDKKFARYIGGLHAGLVEYFRTAYKKDRRSPTDLPLVLNDAEIREVMDAVADLSVMNAGTWDASPHRYRYWVTCAGEIREAPRDRSGC